MYQGATTHSNNAAEMMGLLRAVQGERGEIGVTVFRVDSKYARCQDSKYAASATPPANDSDRQQAWQALAPCATQREPAAGCRESRRRCVDNARLNKLDRTCSFVETI